ncbi:unnamed protein product, partial [Brenthis ino]
MAEALDVLLQPHTMKKEMSFLRLQALYDLSKTVEKDSTALLEFSARVKDIEKIKKTYEESVTQINLLHLNHTPKYIANYKEIEAFDSLYYNIMTVASKHVSANTEQTNTQNARCARPRLPKLELFHFDSRQTFYDTFSSLIHNNAELSNIEKFYYLITSVSGQALNIVKSLPVTADNYTIAWNLLIKRFENKRVLATNYLDRMFQFKPLLIESSVGLNTFLQTFQECYKAINLLNIPDLSSYLLFYIAFRNLDASTRREFEQSRAHDSHLPTFDHLMQFVEKQVRVLELSDPKISTNKVQSSTKPITGAIPKTGYKPTSFSKTSAPIQKPCLTVASVNRPNKNVSVERTCAFCGKSSHSIYRCFAYNDLTPIERLNKIRELKLCENCLRDGHCFSECPSKIKCTLCKQIHHHTLHLDTNLNEDNNNTISSNSSNQNHTVALTCSSNSTVLLGTAVIHVKDNWGSYHSLRAVIDSGAMSSYLTNSCAQRLGLPRRKCSFQPIGLGGVPVQDFGLITCSIKPRNSSGPTLKTDCVVVSKITGNLPTTILSNQIINQFKHLDLADPTYFKSASIDMLLAGDIFPYIYDGQNILPSAPGLPVAMHSIFGYVIAGEASLECKHIENSCLFSTNKNEVSSNIDNIMSSLGNRKRGF